MMSSTVLFLVFFALSAITLAVPTDEDAGHDAGIVSSPEGRACIRFCAQKCFRALSENSSEKLIADIHSPEGRGCIRVCGQKCFRALNDIPV